VCGIVPSSAHMQTASTEDLVCGIVPSSAHMQTASTEDLLCGIVPSSAHMQTASTEDLVCGIVPSSSHLQPASTVQRLWCAALFRLLRTCSQHLQYKGSGVRLYHARRARASGIILSAHCLTGVNGARMNTSGRDGADMARERS
jgi:hypothetical protein